MSSCFLKTVIDGIGWQDNVTWKRISDCIRLLFHSSFFIFPNLWVNSNVYGNQGAASSQGYCSQGLKSISLGSATMSYFALHRPTHTTSNYHSNSQRRLVLLSDANSSCGFMMWLGVNENLWCDFTAAILLNFIPRVVDEKKSQLFYFANI